MNNEMIYAKDVRSGVSLLRHTLDVVEAFRTMFGEARKPTRLGRCWQRFFKLADYEPFYNATLAAAFFHDWGKANDGFQNAVRHNVAQPIRHEHLSALMMFTNEVKQWRESRCDIDWNVVLAAVASHHLKTTLNGFAAGDRTESDRIELLVDRPEFSELISTTSENLHLGGPLPTFENRVWAFTSENSNRYDLSKLRKSVRKLMKRIGADCNREPHDPFSRMVMAVRSALIAADSAGSGMRRAGLSIGAWLEAKFDETQLLSEECIQSEIIDPRISQIKANGRDFQWNDFQNACEQIPDRSLLLAPCGSGKTLAAWRKIAARCRQPVKRVLFLYPTRATATEGFRDYVSWAPEADAALVHGKAGYDLEGMFSNPEDHRSVRNYEQDPRLFALGLWGKRIFSATVDQFLAFLQHAYSPTCLLPVLVDSMIVIDEVHSFDSAMFSALKEFLTAFDVPVLCMTASLTSARTDELQTACGLELVEINDEKLQEIAEAPRYSVSVLNEADDLAIETRITTALSQGKRVLWVVNQVQRAQEAAINFATNFPAHELQVNEYTPLVCYHSRFKLKDRVSRHQQAVALFQQKDHPALAITTQVCEMSLDLDADMIVTEQAPVTSLIQRMGRCNRVKEPRDESGEVIICLRDDPLPYDELSLAGVSEFIAAITSKPRVSQRDLELALAEVQTPAEIHVDSRFIQSGACAQSGEQSFRDIDSFTADAVLDIDVGKFNECLKDRRKRQKALGWITPVPKHFRHEEGAFEHSLPKHLIAAPGENYHPAIGFCNNSIRRPGGYIC